MSEATNEGGAAAGGEGGKSKVEGQAAADETKNKDGAAAAGGEDGEGQGEAPVHPGQALAETPKPEKTAEQLQAEAATGLDLGKYSNEYAEKGKLSDESYAELEKKGITKETVDIYVGGLEARATQRLTGIASVVGGVDKYNAILRWFGSKASDAEKKGAVDALSKGSIESAQTYMQGLQARFIKENGKPPGKSSGGGGAPVGEVFRDRREQARAMHDPRYQSDPEYRREVMEKSRRSFGAPTRKRTKKHNKPLKSIRRRAKKAKR